MSRDMRDCRAWLEAYERGTAPPLSTAEAVRFLRAQAQLIEAQASCVEQQAAVIVRGLCGQELPVRLGRVWES